MSAYTSLPINHPNKVHVATFQGRLEEQDADITRALTRLITHTGDTLSTTGLSENIKLQMSGGITVQGKLLVSSLTVKRGTYVRFLLTSWNKTIFSFLLVELMASGLIIVEHNQNPSDQSQLHRRPFEAVIKPS